MKNICDNNFAPSRDNPDIDDLVVMWARMEAGRPVPVGYGRALGNFADNHGWWLLTWVLDNVRTLVEERYEGDYVLFGKWDCEVNHECYCAYRRAGLSPMDHTLIRGGKAFLNPRTGEEFDRDGNLVAVRALG